MEAVLAIVDMLRADPVESIGLLVFVALWFVYKSDRSGRANLYSHIDAVKDELREDLGKVDQDLRDHEDGCNKRAVDDAKWKGRIEGILKQAGENSHE